MKLTTNKQQNYLSFFNLICHGLGRKACSLCANHIRAYIICVQGVILFFASCGRATKWQISCEENINLLHELDIN